MEVPPEIAFRHFEPTEAVRRAVQEGIESLDAAEPRLTVCRVMVEETGRGIPHVRLDLAVPGDEIVVNREASDEPVGRDAAAVVREAFDVALRQLRERHRRMIEGRR